jgi:predicted aspartyl protease
MTSSFPRLRAASLPIAVLSTSLLAVLATLSAPAAAQDKPACQYVQLAKVPLHYTGAGLQVTMDGTINGTPAVMLADTGFYETQLTRTGTEKRGLRLRPTARKIRGVGGMSDLYATRVDAFAAGPAKPSQGWMDVVGDTGEAPSFDAAVGAPYLLQTDMELALADKEMRFFRPIGCDRTWLAYWSQDANVIPFEINQTSNRPVNPPFTIEVNGQKMLAIIDSGAYRTSIDAHAAERAGIKPGGPDVVEIGSSSGVGTRRVANWQAKVATIKVGDEVVRDGEVAISDTQGQIGVDVLLGDDFLRAHRVLFAMSQKRIYLTYVGGDVFGRKPGIEPWVQREADSGNPDAQMAVATRYRTGSGVPKNPTLAAQWLDKAAAQGNPRANLALARALMQESRYADAAGKLKPALEQLPAERLGALDLYVARVGADAQDAGRKELESTFARSVDDAWPRPIADHYLGRIGRAELLEQARKDEAYARARTCVAAHYLAALQAAQSKQPVPASVPECEPVKPGS